MLLSTMNEWNIRRCEFKSCGYWQHGGKTKIIFLNYCPTRSLGALRAPTSSGRPFGPLDFVLRALRALRPVRWSRLRSGPPFLTIFEFFSGRLDTSGSMVPRLVPEISSLDAFCDGGGGGAGIGDSRSWMSKSWLYKPYLHVTHQSWILWPKMEF